MTIRPEPRALVRCCAVVLLLVAWRGFAEADAAPLDAPTAALLGTWDVEQVAVDQQDQAHWGFQPNDPRLLGRTLVIEPNRVRFNGMPVDCAQTKWSGRASTWATILAKAYKRPAEGGRSAVPTPQDFELALNGTDKASVYPICEATTPKSKGAAYLQARWLVPLGNDRLALRLGSSALLVLVRRAKDAKISASFSCSCAKTPTEKAICASFELAAWDRSLAAAWSQANERTQDEAVLHEEQKEWLKERNACQADAACIEAKLAIRVGQLSSQWIQ